MKQKRRIRPEVTTAFLTSVRAIDQPALPPRETLLEPNRQPHDWARPETASSTMYNWNALIGSIPCSKLHAFLNCLLMKRFYILARSVYISFSIPFFYALLILSTHLGYG